MLRTKEPETSRMRPERSWAIRTTIIGAAILLIAWAAAVTFSRPAGAHDTVSGWAYPWACCAGQDCRPVGCDTLEEIEDGKVRDIENGQVYSRDMVQSSGDNRCHVCTELGKLDGKPICAFLQHGS